MSASSILGLERTTLRDRAVVALRSAIISGELEQGAHVSEVDMAARLGISRGTLREAMRTLELEGLLTPGPRGRLLVRRMSEPELVGLFQVRSALEALAVSLLAAREDRTALVETLASAAQAMAPDKSKSLNDRMLADLDFHRELCRLTGNDSLVRAWEGLVASIQMSITHAGVDRALENINVERHLDIVRAIETGDVGEATDAVESHMRAAVGVLTTS
ncbi:GntR family transcriptional regulator [Microbacterium sp. HMH0099]|uniref:GntR family transcriptional regulator n=1 Tax=Microbacterium sp. HMH0099 TaxID=3414026 RepID=UPI003BF6C383